MQRTLLLVVLCLAFALLGADAAFGHDRETNNGVSVTIHLDPDDEPVATEPATIIVEKVETKATFTWATCRCAWKVTDSSGAVVLQQAAKPKTPIVFPAPGAYQLTLTGRVKVTLKAKTRTRPKKTAWRTFRINYAWRADAPAS
jgi:hypothetical protein